MERDKEDYSFAHQDGKRPRKGPLFGGARLTIEPGSDFPIGINQVDESVRIADQYALLPGLETEAVAEFEQEFL